MQWKGPFELKGCTGGNNYQIEINRKMKTYHINLLKQYVERDNVEMTAMRGRRDFPEGIRKEIRVETGIEVQGVQGVGGRPQAAEVSGIGKIVIGTSANYLIKREDVSVDDKKLLELGPKERISDVCLGVKLGREQQNEIIGVLVKREKNFTDIFGKTSIKKNIGCT